MRLFHAGGKKSNKFVLKYDCKIVQCMHYLIEFNHEIHHDMRVRTMNFPKFSIIIILFKYCFVSFVHCYAYICVFFCRQQKCLKIHI